MGLTPAEFDDLTPAEFFAFADGYLKNAENEQEMAKMRIYSLACAIRTAIWGKRMPQYDQMFAKQKQKEQMTDEAMYQVCEALCRAYGGKIEDYNNGNC